MIQYEQAEDIKARIRRIAEILGFKHLDLERTACIRSRGSASRRVLARCHGLPRIMQAALPAKPLYVIEVIAERFDKLSREEQDKTLIHELCHIPKSFGGGFKYHDCVNRRLVDKLYGEFQKKAMGSGNGAGSCIWIPAPLRRASRAEIRPVAVAAFAGMTVQQAVPGPRPGANEDPAPLP
ncbi:MAG: hypothetical protein HY747_06675 [Elusimicrobia bacterium]|nr:hypothetical protein [Elusimicrobiota bacterium]